MATISSLLHETPAYANPRGSAPLASRGEGRVLSAGDILEKGTRSIEAVTAIAIVAAVSVGGLLLYRLFKLRNEEETQEKALMSTLIEEEVLKERAARAKGLSVMPLVFGAVVLAALLAGFLVTRSAKAETPPGPQKLPPTGLPPGSLPPSGDTRSLPPEVQLEISKQNEDPILQDLLTPPIPAGMVRAVSAVGDPDGRNVVYRKGGLGEGAGDGNMPRELATADAARTFLLALRTKNPGKAVAVFLLGVAGSTRDKAGKERQLVTFLAATGDPSIPRP